MQTRWRLVASFALVAGLPAARPVSAQATAETPSSAAPATEPNAPQPQRTETSASQSRTPDSVRVRRKARSVQSGFESRRRQMLPRFYTGSAERCLIIGRLCYWDSRTSTDLVPAEGDAIRRARAQLLRELETASRVLPGDDWITGQQIRYLIEARDTAAIRAATRDCSATRWWCDALAGYTLHVRGGFAAADTAFARALEAMPRETRCEWIDISRLLESDFRKEYERLSCDERQALAERIWWFADPLLMTPGNERRTEHFSRVVYTALQKDAANTFGMRWGDDLTEMVVRFGWSEKWTRRPESLTSDTRPAVTGHDASPGFHFLVKRRPPESVDLVADSLWDLERTPPQELYAPYYARSFAQLDAQVARFRRGDSTVVIAAYDVGEDTLLRNRKFSAALTVVGDVMSGADTREISEAPLTQVMQITTASPSRLVGLELLAADSAGAVRWRSGFRDLSLNPGRLIVSDLLFVDGGPALPGDLADAVSRAHAGTVFSRSAKVALFWELYGKAPADTALPVSLTISPLGAGFLRSAMRALRLAPKATPLSVRWQENGASGVLSARSVLLDMSLVPPGRYEVKLEVGASNPASTSTVIRIR